MNKKLCIIAGHGAGDPGAIGYGQEAEYTRKAAKKLYELCKNSVETMLYPVEQDLYQSRDYQKISSEYEVVELHFNANARFDECFGTEVLISNRKEIDNVDKSILNVLSKYYPLRGANGIQYRDDLLSIQTFVNQGVGHRIVEFCFITTKAEMDLFDQRFETIMSELATSLIGAIGGGPLGGGQLTKIEGAAQAVEAQMINYIKSVNASVAKSVLEMIPYYLSEGKCEGIRGDVAFAQSCLETGNFKFAGSIVTLNDCNFCGLGVTGEVGKKHIFSTPQMGIRAQIQHLKAYANQATLKQPCVDPRFQYVTRGSAPYVEYLGQQENPNGVGWAAGAKYGDKILAILKKVLSAEGSDLVSSECNDVAVPFQIKRQANGLKIRAGAGTQYPVVSVITDQLRYTIVAVDGDWGKLKSGLGWVCLNDTNYNQKEVNVLEQQGTRLPFLVQVTVEALNIRAGAGTGYEVVDVIRDCGIYTIVEVRDNWGRLKSGLGWICLEYVKEM